MQKGLPTKHYIYVYAYVAKELLHLVQLFQKMLLKAL